MQTSTSVLKRRDFLKAVGVTAAGLTFGGCLAESMNLAGKGEKDRPNILFCISDDQCWLHAGAYGDKVVKTYTVYTKTEEEIAEEAIEAVRQTRASLYPPVEDYVDGIVKGDDVQVQAYIDACLKVKEDNPFPV